jgi:hypothetical protein
MTDLMMNFAKSKVVLRFHMSYTACAGGFFAPRHEPAIENTCLHAYEAVGIMDFVQLHEGEDLADCRNRALAIRGLCIRRFGRLDEMERSTSHVLCEEAVDADDQVVLIGDQWPAEMVRPAAICQSFPDV